MASFGWGRPPRRQGLTIPTVDHSDAIESENSYHGSALSSDAVIALGIGCLKALALANDEGANILIDTLSFSLFSKTSLSRHFAGFFTQHIGVVRPFDHA
jgi:hypothetical protein